MFLTTFLYQQPNDMNNVNDVVDLTKSVGGLFQQIHDMNWDLNRTVLETVDGFCSKLSKHYTQNHFVDIMFLGGTVDIG